MNKHLNKLNIEVANLSTDFKDGVYLCLLMGLLGGFFVPLYDFHLTPRDSDQMVNSLRHSLHCAVNVLIIDFIATNRFIMLPFHLN